MKGAGFRNGRDTLFGRNLTLQESSAPGTAVLERATRIEPGPPRPRRPFGYFLWLLAAVLIAAIGLVLHNRDEIAARLVPVYPAAVQTVEVRSGTLEQTLRLTGATVAEHSVFLRAPYLRGRRSRGAGDFGLVLQKLAVSGARVQKNDLVASFDPLFMRNRFDNVRAERVDAELNLGTMRAALDVRRVARRQQIQAAKGRMEKAGLDLKTGPVRSRIQVALFQLAFEEARAAYEALVAETKYVEAGERAEIRRADLAFQEAKLEESRAEANLDRFIARAPVEGLVVISQTFRGSEFSQIRVGDQVRPGQPYAQIVDTRSMIIEATANQVDIEHLRIGGQARVHFDAYPDLEISARVYSIGAFAKSGGWRGNYVTEVPVFLKLDRVDPRLIPNLTVSADVILRREWSEEIVPREAVFYDAEGGQPFAYVQTPSGWEKRELELGLANYVDVALHSGLSPGEIVAVNEPPA